MYYHFSFVLFIFKKLVVFHYTEKLVMWPISLFSSPELKAQVSFSDHLSSVVCLSVCLDSLSVCLGLRELHCGYEYKFKHALWGKLELWGYPHMAECLQMNCGYVFSSETRISPECIVQCPNSILSVSKIVCFARVTSP